MTTEDVQGIVFLTSLDDALCARAFEYIGAGLVVRDIESLSLARGSILLSHGTSVIVPPGVLERFSGGAYNIHAASPEYPGRDPHHWAVYDGVTRYGSTLHVMTEKVDDGPIVDVEWFDVAPNTSPAKLLAAANDASFRLIERYGPRLRRGEPLTPMPDIQWGEKKRSRADFHAMCRIAPSVSREELERRFFAFDGGEFDNLTIELHGRLFRIDKS